MSVYALVIGTNITTAGKGVTLAGRIDGFCKADTHRPVDATVMALQHILHDRVATAKQVRVHLQHQINVMCKRSIC